MRSSLPADQQRDLEEKGKAIKNRVDALIERSRRTRGEGSTNGTSPRHAVSGL